MHDASFLRDLALVLCVAALTTAVLRLVKQPPIVGYLVAGVVVGPYTDFGTFADQDRVRSLSDFGVVLVMFGVGLELNLRRLFRLLPRSGLIAVLQVSAMIVAGTTIGRVLGSSPLEAVFLGASLALSSTVLVVKTFDEHPPEIRLRELVFGVLVVQDVIAVVLTSALTAAAVGQAAGGSLGPMALQLVGFVVLTLVIGLLFVPWAVRRLAARGSAETLIVGSVGLCFALALVAEEAGHSLALGAFLAGVLVSESGRGREIEDLIRPLRDVFAAVFFVSIGMTMDPRVVASSPVQIATLVVVVVFGQLSAVVVGGVLAGNGLRGSVHAGLLLGQVGEFGFILTAIGVSHGVVRAEFQSLVVATAVVTAFTTPVLSRLAPRAAAFFEHRVPARLQHVLGLYESWLTDVGRIPVGDPMWARMRRLAIVAIADGAVAAVLVLTAKVWAPPLSDAISELFGVTETLAQWVIHGLLLLGCSPFVLTLLRVTDRMGTLLADRILPSREGVDLAAAPRKFVAGAVRFALVLAVALPVSALAWVVVPGSVVVPLLAIVAAMGLGAFWRGATQADGHVKAAAGALVELLAEPDHDRATVDSILPGFGAITTLDVPAGAPCVGRSLGEIDLRADTGVTVVAIRRGGGGVATPGGHERIAAGDVLALVGTSEALGHARRKLLVDATPRRS